MQNHKQSDRLSWGDTVFLHLEREGMPLNVASICLFEGEISLEDCVQFIESKLPLVPVISSASSPRRSVWPSQLGIRCGVRPSPPCAGSYAQPRYRRGTENLRRKTLWRGDGPATPLWDITVVRGLKGNRTGLIIRLHHCMADGIAGVGIMNALLDTSPEAPRLPKKKIKFHVRAARPIGLAYGRVRGLVFRFRETNSLRHGRLAEHGGACGRERPECGHRRVASLFPESQRLPNGSVSTFFIKDRRNSPALRFPWRKSKPSGRNAAPA